MTFDSFCVALIKYLFIFNSEATGTTTLDGNPGSVFLSLNWCYLTQSLLVSTNVRDGDVFRILSNNYNGAFWENG